MNEPKELWKPIEGYEGLYEVSNLGRVRSLPMLINRWRFGCISTAGRILRPSWSSGYLYVGLCKGGKQKRIAVSVLVCAAFNGARGSGQQAAHRDGDRANNRADNLRWATCLENARDKFGHGTQPLGENHRAAKLKASDVLEIRARLRDGESQHSIANTIGVSRGAVSDIKRGKSWAHV